MVVMDTSVKLNVEYQGKNPVEAKGDKLTYIYRSVLRRNCILDKEGLRELNRLNSMQKQVSAELIRVKQMKEAILDCFVVSKDKVNTESVRSKSLPRLTEENLAKLDALSLRSGSTELTKSPCSPKLATSPKLPKVSRNTNLTSRSKRHGTTTKKFTESSNLKTNFNLREDIKLRGKFREIGCKVIGQDIERIKKSRRQASTTNGHGSTKTDLKKIRETPQQDVFSTPQYDVTSSPNVTYDDIEDESAPVNEFALSAFRAHVPIPLYAQSVCSMSTKAPSVVRTRRRTQSESQLPNAVGLTSRMSRKDSQNLEQAYTRIRNMEQYSSEECKAERKKRFADLVETVVKQKRVINSWTPYISGFDDLVIEQAENDEC